MSVLQLDADGARLYRRLTSQTLVPAVPAVPPGTVEHVTTRLCGWYPKNLLRGAESGIVDGRRQYTGLNYELLRSTGPAESRTSYFNGAPVPPGEDLGYVCADFEVPRTAAPVAGSDPVVETLATPGWDAGAVSAKAFYRNGRVRFKTKADAKMIVGLQEGSDPTAPTSRFFGVDFSPYVDGYSYGYFYAFLFRGGFGDEGSVETGATPSGGYGVLSESVMYEVELLHNRVTIKLDYLNPSIFSPPFTFDLSPQWQRPGVWSLGAAIWEPGAFVDGIEVTQYDGGALQLPALKMGAGQGAPKKGGNLATPRLVATGRNKTSAGTALPAMKLRGGDGSLAEAALTTPLLTARGEALVGAGVPYGRLRTKPLKVAGSGKAGTVGRGALALPAMKLRGTKGNKADGILALPAVVAFGYDMPRDVAIFYSHGGGESALAAFTELAVIMNSAGQMTTALAVGLLKDATATSSASLSSTMTLSAVLEALMESRALVGADVPLYEQGAEVWVVNLANNATTTFEGYPFNSFATIGGRAFGAKADGLYLLEGDTDNGLPIKASVSYGKQDFGSPTMKHMSRAYVGASSTGKLYLRVVADDKTYTYAARDSSAHIAQQRFDVGRGIQANYFTFELVNNNGGDFEIDSVSFFAAEFKRRI